LKDAAQAVAEQEPHGDGIFVAVSANSIRVDAAIGA
jgi:hypothetical protein